MKNKLIALILLIPILIGCKAINELTKFDLNFKRNFTIPPLPVAGTAPALEMKDIETNIDSVLTSYNLKPDRIQSVTLTSMKLTLTAPAGSDLSFLKSAEIFLTADGLTDVKVASVTEVPDNTREIEMIVEGTDLKNFILKDKFGLKIMIVTDKPTVVEHRIDIAMAYVVDLKILGI